MSWASRRKALVFLIAIGFFLLVSIPLGFVFYPKQSCFDGKQNQNERGIDCGGVCENICKQDIFPISILWSRSFSVAPGVYNAVAYVSNPNLDLSARNLSYVFEFYDDRNVFIDSVKGATYIPPGQNSPIFIGPISTEKRSIAKTFFYFTKEPVWEKKSIDKEGNINILEYKLNESPTPRLEVEVKNDSTKNLEEFSLVVVIYDLSSNAMAASRTIVRDLARGAERKVIFTWPEPFISAFSKVEIYPVLE